MQICLAMWLDGFEFYLFLTRGYPLIIMVVDEYI